MQALSLYSNFYDCKSFVESYFPDTLALCGLKLEDSLSGDLLLFHKDAHIDCQKSAPLHSTFSDWLWCFSWLYVRCSNGRYIYNCVSLHGF